MDAVDEELRKVVELLMGGFIFSGQEKPTGTKQALREDLLKKFGTAEGISGRLPYAILTRLFQVIGCCLGAVLERNMLLVGAATVVGGGGELFNPFQTLEVYVP